MCIRDSTDTDGEIAVVDQCCKELGVPYALSEVFAKGGEGGIDLANTVLDVLEKTEGQYQFKPIYELKQPIENKIEAVCKNIYGADGVEYSASAKKAIAEITDLGFGSLPVCMAKTQYSCLLYTSPDHSRLCLHLWRAL